MSFDHRKPFENINSINTLKYRYRKDDENLLMDETRKKRGLNFAALDGQWWLLHLAKHPQA